MQSARSPDAVSPHHFIIEKGLIDARGEVGARAQVIIGTFFIVTGLTRMYLAIPFLPTR